MGPECLIEAELCGKFCAAQGWRSRPLWIDIAAGLRPPEPSSADIALGEWKHGWQFHASDALAKSSLEVLKRSLSAPSYRSNAATPGKSRLRSCTGPFSSTWMTNCPTTSGLTLQNGDMQFAMRRRLGIGVCFDGADPHGHSRVAARGAQMNARHSTLVSAWRQVMTEAGGHIPQRNVERMLVNTHVPVPADDRRRMDLVVPGLNVHRGLVLFCDATIISPISGNGSARAGTSNADGRLLEHAQADNDAIYRKVIAPDLARSCAWVAKYMDVGAPSQSNLCQP